MNKSEIQKEIARLAAVVARDKADKEFKGHCEIRNRIPKEVFFALCKLEVKKNG